MALEDLNPAVRVEEILDGADIEPATRLEYFMKKAANEVPKPAGSSDAGKVVTVNEDGDGFELSDVDPGLPEISGVSDAGKVISVNAAGSAYELATPSSGGGAAIITLGLRTASGNVANYAFYENGTEVVGYNNCAAILSAIGDAPIIVDAFGAKCTVVQKDSSSVLFYFSDDYSTARLKSAGFVEDSH